MLKVIIFGAGRYAKCLLQKPLQNDVEILFICDNDGKKWESDFCGYSVVSPQKIYDAVYDNIVILTTDRRIMDEIMDQLEDMGINLEKVILPIGLSDVCEGPLDKIFYIDKVPPKVPFSYQPIKVEQEYHGETYKSRNRRKREGFFDKYCKGVGLDIGYAGFEGSADLIVPECCGWDMQNGDAQYLRGVGDESFDFVYSSHCLEHVNDVRVALKNWFRVVKAGGYLLLAVPHRDLYEKKKRLPGRWNGDHKHMFLIGRRETPHTLDIVEEIRESLMYGYSIKYVKECSDGHTITDPFIHSDGEYQIEVVIQKSLY